MSKLIDLSNKLTFEKVAEVKITDDFSLHVDISAETTLKVVAMMDDEYESEYEMFDKLVELSVPEEEWKAFMALKPAIDDWKMVMGTLMELITGSAEESSGE